MPLGQWRCGTVFQAGAWSCQRPVQASGASACPAGVCRVFCVFFAQDWKAVAARAAAPSPPAACLCPEARPAASAVPHRPVVHTHGVFPVP